MKLNTIMENKMKCKYCEGEFYILDGKDICHPCDNFKEKLPCFGIPYKAIMLIVKDLDDEDAKLSKSNITR